MEIASWIAGVGTSFSVLKDMGGAMLNERDRQKAATIHIQFTEKLIDTQAQLSQVLSAVIEQQRQIPVLEQRIRELEAERAEKQRYVLAKFGSEREFFVYRLRDAAELDERADEIPHAICQPCFEAGKKILIVGNGDGYWHCPVCKHGAQVTAPTPDPRFMYGGRGGLSGY